MEYLLTLNPNLVNIVDNCGLSVYHWCAKRGHAEILMKLIKDDGKESLSKKDMVGRTPL